MAAKTKKTEVEEPVLVRATSKYVRVSPRKARFHRLASSRNHSQKTESGDQIRFLSGRAIQRARRDRPTQREGCVRTGANNAALGSSRGQDCGP